MATKNNTTIVFSSKALLNRASSGYGIIDGICLKGINIIESINSFYNELKMKDRNIYNRRFKIIYSMFISSLLNRTILLSPIDMPDIMYKKATIPWTISGIINRSKNYNDIYFTDDQMNSLKYVFSKVSERIGIPIDGLESIDIPEPSDSFIDKVEKVSKENDLSLLDSTTIRIIICDILDKYPDLAPRVIEHPNTPKDLKESIIANQMKSCYAIGWTAIIRAFDDDVKLIVAFIPVSECMADKHIINDNILTDKFITNNLIAYSKSILNKRSIEELLDIYSKLKKHVSFVPVDLEAIYELDIDIPDTFNVKEGYDICEELRQQGLSLPTIMKNRLRWIEFEIKDHAKDFK